ncbi:MAG: metallophosphoesterase [Anaerolineales bacterium]
MKILALSDEVVPSLYDPSIRERYGDIDLVVGCGDVPFYYLEFVVSVLNVPLYYVHGNHDHAKQYMADGRVATAAEGCVCIDDQVANIDGLTTQAGGLLLAGLGGSMRYRPGDHQYNEPEMRARARKMALRLWLNRLRHGRFLDILLTHSPPYGIHDKQDPAHVGFQTFLTMLRRYRPRFMLHGHSHVLRHNAVTRTQYFESEIINVYPYRVIEI